MSRSPAAQVSTPDAAVVIRSGYLPDPRSRLRRLLPPVATLIGLLLATMYVRQVNPNVPGHYPGCPTQVFLGIDCPGCGGLRATHSLAQGDVVAALDHNLLVVVLVPVVLVMLGAWLLRAWRGIVTDTATMSPSQKRVQQLVPIVLLVAMALFTLIRNLTPYGASGIG
ncbi:MAG: DUF2752 domain-containing protein [Candidatus Nanopelagicales bacterium]